MIIKYYIDGKPVYLIKPENRPRPRLNRETDSKFAETEFLGYTTKDTARTEKNGGKAYRQDCKDAERDPYIVKIVVTVYV